MGLRAPYGECRAQSAVDGAPETEPVVRESGAKLCETESFLSFRSANEVQICLFLLSVNCPNIIVFEEYCCISVWRHCVSHCDKGVVQKLKKNETLKRGERVLEPVAA